MRENEVVVGRSATPLCQNKIHCIPSPLNLPQVARYFIYGGGPSSRIYVNNYTYKKLNPKENKSSSPKAPDTLCKVTAAETTAKSGTRAVAALLLQTSGPPRASSEMVVA